MSKQSEAKAIQGYIAKAIPAVCSNCKHYESKITEREGIFGGTYIVESDRRCGIGGFAVKKTAVCDRHEMA